ncbi:hypothetical protein [Sellimonas intestinalis]|uniref:hypothetical protein n=1 Tax=Sellimonas intestinalis TaxID=1653434 RepID=UPI0015EB2F83|nr:hypothetical protein [Sellimonas intestinalis]MBA2214187.1 hypothetical protein [Sellimonas intestinalis]
MESIVRKTYQTLREEITDDGINRHLEKDIEKILKKANGEWKEEKELRDLAFRFAEAGEEAGFVRGFRYAFQLFNECF